MLYFFNLKVFIGSRYFTKKPRWFFMAVARKTNLNKLLC